VQIGALIKAKAAAYPESLDVIGLTVFRLPEGFVRLGKCSETSVFKINTYS
jgi:hypothetical protein